MKYLYCFLLFLTFSFSAEAQRITVFPDSGDTLVDNATAYLTLPIVNSHSKVVFTGKLVKIDGTIAGTITLQQSGNGVDWEIATGTTALTNSNAATNFKNFEIADPAFPYYRFMFSGGTTMRGRMYGYAHTKSK